jgi:hypothetical protein
VVQEEAILIQVQFIDMPVAAVAPEVTERLRKWRHMEIPITWVAVEMVASVSMGMAVVVVVPRAWVAQARELQAAVPPAPSREQV